MRSPSFPPGSFVSLTPPPSSSPYHSDAALIFSCRTNVPSSSATRRGSSARRSSESDTTLTGDPTLHSYPPTPPQNPIVRVSPPSPKSVQARLSEIPLPIQQITTFILTPHSHAHIPEQKDLSVFARVVSALKNSAPSHSSSFTLSPLPTGTSSQNSAIVTTPIPLLAYHDRTPAWKVSSTQGILEMDTRQESELGVHPSFYIAAALAYLDFLTEREVRMSSHKTAHHTLTLLVLFPELSGRSRGLAHLMDRNMGWTCINGRQFGIY